MAAADLAMRVDEARRGRRTYWTNSLESRHDSHCNRLPEVLGEAPLTSVAKRGCR